MQSGYDMNDLAREALTRWLKPVEVFFILQNYEERHLTHKVPQKPPGGSLYLFNKRVLKFFRKDGHSWRRRKDKRNIAEAHERLKVGNAEAINCYYAHGEENPNFQRRSYWILERAYEHIVLVHYRDISKGKENPVPAYQFSTPSSTFSHPSGSTSFAIDKPDSSFVIAESHEFCHNKSSPSSLEITSIQSIHDNGMNQPDNKEITDEVRNSSPPALSHALRRLEQQLSLNDDEINIPGTLYNENEDSNDLEALLRDYEFSGQSLHGPENLFSRQSGDGVCQLPGVEAEIWNEILDSSVNLPNAELQEHFERQDASLILQEVDSLKYHACSPLQHSFGTTPDCFSSLLEQDGLGISLENNISLIVSQKQKFTIREISPEWCYTAEGAKIIIIGSFLCDPSECAWACMIGDTEVPAQIIQEGVLRCYAPPHLQGKVNICITSGNRESCSEVMDFEYHVKSNTSSAPETEANISSEELLLLVRFVQMLLSDSKMLQKGTSESTIDLLGKSRIAEDSWSHIIDALLVGASTSSNTIYWLLQELLKDKLGVWLSLKLQTNNHKGFSLTKKEQGVIHMVAGLGFEWALQPILNSGVNIDFRDINGWTALHWAARFGREEMVAALIASGASAGAVTDPNSKDHTGQTPASIAATCGHKGLAGYLSEVALTSHLSSLTLLESELSKGSAALEAERRVNDSFSKASSSANVDQDSLRDTLAAVRNASQAAARIQSAFRAHSFRKNQHKKEMNLVLEDYSIIEINDIHGLSAASKLTLGNAHGYDSAALSIQKKYRGWKGRKDFLSLCQKVVKIQAHVRGYQARRKYMVCWAVSILEKVVLRWYRRGVGLRGFQLDLGSFDEDDEDEDILKVFRKLKVDDAIHEAVSRVISMVDSPTARLQYRRLLENYRQAKFDNERNQISSEGGW